MLNKPAKEDFFRDRNVSTLFVALGCSVCMSYLNICLAVYVKRISLD